MKVKTIVRESEDKLDESVNAHISVLEGRGLEIVAINLAVLHIATYLHPKYVAMVVYK